MAALLTDAEIRDGLAQLAGWQRADDRAGGVPAIERTVQAGSFPGAVALVGRVADAAEAAGHHPDIDIRYSAVTLRLTTHSEGGLTAADLEMAAAIDTIAAAAAAGRD